MGAQPSKSDIAAVVVLYNPSRDVLENVASYAPQVGVVFAVDNSDAPDFALLGELAAMGVICVPMGGNRGIAAALNAGCRRALELGHPWVLTMDQDSTATPTLVEGLSRVLCGADSEDIALVAPMWQQVGGASVKTFTDEFELDYAMTSGNLLRLSVFEALGGFREDFFIDHVDNEFCLRARREGWRVVQKRDVILFHRMGSMEHVSFPFPFFTSNYSPLRRYYMVRNLFEMEREFGQEFPTWLHNEHAHWRKELLKMILGEKHRVRKFRMMYRGWSDFRKRRFGRYDELHTS